MKLLLTCLVGLLLHAQLFSQNKDQEAIKKVCIAETQAYNDFDLDKLASYHVKSATDQLAWNNADGSFGFETGWDNIYKNLKDWFANAKKEKQELTSDNFQYNIAGDFAFVSYSSTTKNAQGKISKQRDYKTLKRINGQWKLFTIQAYFDYSAGK